MQPGKLRGLQRLADDQGRFTMLAVDQRPPVHALVAERRGVDAASPDDVLLLKRAVIEALGVEASATLVDPVTVFSSLDLLDPRRGLVLTLEDSAFDEGPGGRRSREIEGWSVDQIKRFGADAVKLLAWFRPDADDAVIEDQEAFVASVGEACRRYDVPFVFELLLYPLARDGERALLSDTAWRAEHVIASLEHFAPARYGVDVFKVESPVVPATLPSRDQDDRSHRAAFEAISQAVARPWVLLSGGADRFGFVRALEYAFAAGASGYLAGRSIWWDAVSEFPDLDRVRRALTSDAVPFMRQINALTTEHATPWWTHVQIGLDDPHHRSYASIDAHTVGER